MCIVGANRRKQKKGRPLARAPLFWRTSTTWLREDANNHAAVLRTAFASLVRRHRLFFTVADHVDLVERHLVLLVEIPLHGFGALHPERLVVRLVTDVVRVTLDLDVDPLRVSLELRNQLIQSRFGLVRQFLLAELEVALVFAQG